MGQRLLGCVRRRPGRAARNHDRLHARLRRRRPTNHVVTYNGTTGALVTDNIVTAGAVLAVDTVGDYWVAGTKRTTAGDDHRHTVGFSAHPRWRSPDIQSRHGSRW